MSDRSAISARFALAALSLVAAWSLARCFVGPGEVIPAVAAVAVAEVSVLAAGALAPRHRFAAPLLALVGIAGVALIPLWIVAGGATSWGWPTFSAWHVVGRDLQQSWRVFNQLRAPVPEMPGFSLVGAWAVGGAALLAGWAADGGDTPLWVVAPPLAVFFFTAALGTAQWRALAIALEVMALAWYAVSARAARRAQTMATAAPVGPAPGRRLRALPSPGIAAQVAVVIAVAALLAAFLGPRLPGALSPPLVSLRGSGTGGATPGETATGAAVPPPSTGQISVSTLVQVAQEEIYQPHVAFFSVTSPVPSYLVLTTLDSFDGDRWTAGTPVGLPDVLLGLPGVSPLRNVTKTDGGTASLFETQIVVGRLGGGDVPGPMLPEEADGSTRLTYDVTSNTIESDASLKPGMIFDVVSSLPIASPDTAPASFGPITSELEGDLTLPAGMPAAIIRIAHEIVRGQKTEYGKALALQSFFTSGAFAYSLPAPGTTSNPTVTGGEGLRDLEQFIFDTRTGFCQQFASAFAVLARIDGLPTRVAVGFVPGSGSSGTYVVDGTDVHAWPQVYLGGAFGWWNFEPTPGSALPSVPFQVTPSTNPSTGRGSTGALGRAHNFAPPPAAIAGALLPKKTPGATSATTSGSTSSGLSWTVLFEILLLVFVVVLAAAPIARLIRRRRARSAAARVVTAWNEAAFALELVGVQQRDGETYSELASRVSTAGALPPDVSLQLVSLARHTTVAAYAPTAPPPESVREAIFASRGICSAVHRRAGPWRSAWALVSPRGLIEQGRK